jgi:hypothetical protein
MPDDTVARSGPRVEMRAIEAYRVEDTFPRLGRANVPQAIIETQYALDVRALAGFSTPLASALARFHDRTFA